MGETKLTTKSSAKMSQMVVNWKKSVFLDEHWKDPHQEQTEDRAENSNRISPEKMDLEEEEFK